MEQSSLVALGNSTHRLSKYGELLAVPRWDPRKESQYVDCQTFSVFHILHNHERVKKSCVFSVAGKIDDIDFMGDFWQGFFPVATFTFRV